MRRIATAGTVLAFAAALSVPIATAGAGQNANCDDFTYQEDAQAALPANPGLDGNDNDGQACEDLPHRPASEQPPATTAPPTATPAPLTPGTARFTG